MEITGTGYLIILLTLYAFTLNQSLLYKLTIFFIPFSATAVINVGAGDNGSAVPPYMFVGAFWILSLLIKKQTFVKARFVDKYELTAITLLLVFAFIASISIIMPQLIDGRETANQLGRLNDYKPVKFSSKNVTQLGYLLFGVVFSIAIYIHNKDYVNYSATIKVYAWSIIFVICWGMLELFCFYTGITYPHLIFNNSISTSAGGYGGFVDESALKRISSVAVEPSILVQNLIIIFPLLGLHVLLKKNLFSRKIDIAYLVILMIFIIRTTSTTGLVCLAVSVLLIEWYYLKFLSYKKKITVILFTVVMLPIAALIMYVLFTDIFEKVLFGKSDSYSALERLTSVSDAWQNFLKHPFLGLGWGSVTSYDLIVKLLSNTGLLGFFAFSSYLIVLVRNQSKKFNSLNTNVHLNMAICIAFFAVICSNLISGFSFVFGFFWFITGLMMVSKTNNSTLNT